MAEFLRQKNVFYASVGTLLVLTLYFKIAALFLAKQCLTSALR